MATRAAGRSAIRPPTSRSAPICGPRFGIYAVRGRLRTAGCWTAPPISASGRPSSRRGSCSSPISSISTATFTASAIEVELISFLRPEAKFEDIDALQGADRARLRARRGGGWRNEPMAMSAGSCGGAGRGGAVADQRLLARADAEGRAGAGRPSRHRPADRPRRAGRRRPAARARSAASGHGSSRTRSSRCRARSRDGAGAARARRPAQRRRPCGGLPRLDARMPHQRHRARSASDRWPS